ncbi:MAG: radical SAM protein, partial [Treponema sp.]|nr:radical SAM protein [Treponema sp.]
MTTHNCNQRCKHCYIDFPLKKNVQDFIPIEKVSEALNDLKGEDLQIIYLTGAEPMLHPNFNAMLRLCLSKSSVCICTNASLINEKKARFLKKVEQEGSNEIIFRLSLDHYDEIKNDNIRCRGAYRQTLRRNGALTAFGGFFRFVVGFFFRRGGFFDFFLRFFGGGFRFFLRFVDGRVGFFFRFFFRFFDRFSRFLFRVFEFFFRFFDRFSRFYLRFVGGFLRGAVGDVSGAFLKSVRGGRDALRALFNDSSRSAFNDVRRVDDRLR